VVSAAWRPLRGVDFARLREARLQAHHALQLLARAARAFAPPQPDDSHTSLGWLDAHDAFTTHSFRGDLRVALRITDLSLSIDDAGAQQSFALDARTEADARAWLGECLAAHGFDPRRLDAKLPYEVSEHAVARGAVYRAHASADALAELAAWFANGHAALGRVRDQMIARGLAPSPVRTWPHHFDMATLVMLEARSAEHARSVNAGLSPGDEHYEEPYFYVSPHPYPDPANLPPLPAVAHWHTRAFTAAIAPASRILASQDRQGATEEFLDTAVAAAVAALA